MTSPTAPFQPQTPEERLIVALDVPAQQALSLAKTLKQVGVKWVKVGMSLYYEQGPQILSALREEGLEVFLDLKLHDIPETVARTVGTLVRAGATFLNVHASGGPAMLQAARRAADETASAMGVPRPHVIGVTVLTSMSQRELGEHLGIIRPVPQVVHDWAVACHQAGLDGVVCSAQEAPVLRQSTALPPEFLLVTPGIRPADVAANDQHRILTPADALRAGSSMLVVGRPIIAAADPLAATQTILDQMREALAANVVQPI